MNSRDDFPWNENELVRKAYEQDNYLICETGNLTGRAIIFFSSNGIYYPNDEDTFANYIAKGNDGFEWIHLAQHKRIQQYFQKIIFVRDIYKQWYVTGINAKINSVDKLHAFLEKELQDLHVFTCGGSAGGYAAALFGALLHADSIFVNSGQFLIQPNVKFGPFVEEYASDPARRKYYDLAPILKERSNIFYSYPALCPDDILQYQHIKGTTGGVLHINSAIHGKTFDGICWPYLLTMDHATRLALYQKYDGIRIDGHIIKKEIVPFAERWFSIFRKVIKKVCKRVE